MVSYSNIGRSTPRREGESKVTGGAQSTADLTLPGTLWGRVLRSPFPHARITHIDASAAQQVPGVMAVLTGAALKGVRYGRRLYDVPVLAEDRVRFVGERVAAVAAVDRDDLLADTHDKWTFVQLMNQLVPPPPQLGHIRTLSIINFDYCTILFLL